MSGDGAARHFDRHDRGATFQERNHENPQYVEECVFFFGSFGHVGGDGADQSVAEQNAEKRSHQRGGDLVSDLFRRTAEGAHGDDDAEHGGDNARGRAESRPWC